MQNLKLITHSSNVEPVNQNHRAHLLISLFLNPLHTAQFKLQKDAGEIEFAYDLFEQNELKYTVMKQKKSTSIVLTDDEHLEDFLKKKNRESIAIAWTQKKHSDALTHEQLSYMSPAEFSQDDEANEEDAKTWTLFCRQKGPAEENLVIEQNEPLTARCSEHTLFWDPPETSDASVPEEEFISFSELSRKTIKCLKGWSWMDVLEGC